VVDWEQAQIGDRLSDMGLLAAPSYLLGAQGPPAQLPIVADYGVRSGADLEALPYWVLAGATQVGGDPPDLVGGGR